tara:strand:+ start:322 stop:447 length:126 start_codon:yes stop_codon:yes gene_type:complete
MKKLILIAIVAFALSSCGSGNYIPCPAYSSWDGNGKTVVCR